MYSIFFILFFSLFSLIKQVDRRFDLSFFTLFFLHFLPIQKFTHFVFIIFLALFIVLIFPQTKCKPHQILLSTLTLKLTRTTDKAINKSKISTIRHKYSLDTQDTCSAHSLPWNLFLFSQLTQFFF